MNNKSNTVSRSNIFSVQHKQSDRIQHAFKPILVLAQCFALFPVDGISSTTSDLKFSWKNFKFFYSCLLLTGSTTLFLFSVKQIISGFVAADRISNVVFYLTTSIIMLLFIKLAYRWPNLVDSWEKVDHVLASRNYLQNSKNFSLNLKFKINAMVIMVLGLVENILSFLYGCHNAILLVKSQGKNDIGEIAEKFFIGNFPQLMSESNYAFWKGCIAYIVVFYCTFSWNFMDLFLILVSAAITDQFKRLNCRLVSVKGKEMPEWWWADVRSDYNRLTDIIEQIDSEISSIVLLSFSVNLYFICVQLLNSFKFESTFLHTLYFCFSLSFLILRALSVSLFAAKIHEESNVPASILYHVPTTSYSVEVKRFLHQVTTDNVCLTGIKFFSVTRSLILTVFSTIVTYEIVLVQFNTIQDST